jgi:hypothetical protein
LCNYSFSLDLQGFQKSAEMKVSSGTLILSFLVAHRSLNSVQLTITYSLEEILKEIKQSLNNRPLVKIKNCGVVRSE